MPMPNDPVLVARHFSAHAARALMLLARAAAPPDLDKARDLFSAAFGIVTALYDDAAVRRARALAYAAVGIDQKANLTTDDTLGIMAAMVELLDAPPERGH